MTWHPKYSSLSHNSLKTFSLIEVIQSMNSGITDVDQLEMSLFEEELGIDEHVSVRTEMFSTNSCLVLGYPSTYSNEHQHGMDSLSSSSSLEDVKGEKAKSLRRRTTRSSSWSPEDFWTAHFGQTHEGTEMLCTSEGMRYDLAQSIAACVQQVWSLNTDQASDTTKVKSIAVELDDQDDASEGKCPQNAMQCFELIRPDDFDL